MSVDVRVRPNARKNQVGGSVGDRLLVLVAAPAVDGKANAAVIAVLADAVGVRARQIQITSGQHARDKRIAIDVEEAELPTLSSQIEQLRTT